MRLVLVTTDFPPEVGGTQTYAFELASRMHREVDQFVVVTPGGTDCATADGLLPFRVERVKSPTDVFSFRARRVLKRLFINEKFDTAFCVAWPSAMACLRACPRRENLSIFCAAHGRELLINPWARFPVLRAMPGISNLYPHFRRKVLNGVDAFFPVSRYTGDLLLGLGARNEDLFIHGNGTDPDHFFPDNSAIVNEQIQPSGRPVILTVARLVERKGIDTVLAAIGSVRKVVPDVLYLIGGKGPDSARLESIVESEGLSEHVRFLGPISYEDLRPLYNACDVFVMPARERRPDVEGFGIVFLEASACAKPVVGARTGGIPDAIVDDVTGLLVPPDDPQRLAETIIRILSDPALAGRLGQAGRAHVLGTANWDTVSHGILSDMQKVVVRN